MKIVKVGPNEYWTVPEGVNVLDHVKPGVRVQWLEKLPPCSIHISNHSNGIKQWAIDTSNQNAEHQRAYRERMKAAGLIRVCAWVHPNNAAKLHDYARDLK